MRTATVVSATRPRPKPARRPPPDPAFAARPRLLALRDALRAAAPVTPARPGEVPVFFLDPARQTELLAARPPAPSPAPHPLAGSIAAELPGLCASAEVRRVARAVPGLRAAADALAPAVPPARDLADLLAVPDDETVVALHPATRTGFRLSLRGVADVAQLHVLLLDAVTGDPADGFLDGPPPAARLVAASRHPHPVTPAGVPMTVAEAYQLYRPAALRRDGTLPDGFDGCRHWLWHHEPVAALPRLDGERLILLGEPAYRRTWEVRRRFPAMSAEVELLRVLGPFEVADRLRRLTGGAVPARKPAVARRELARAA